MSKRSGGGSMVGGSALLGRPAVPSVNLIPASVDQARAGRAAQIKAIIAVALVVVLLGGGYVFLLSWKASADDRVEAAQAEADRLTAERAQYADVSAVVTALDEAQRSRVAAMGYEVKWAVLLGAMVESRPGDSLVGSISGLGMSAAQSLPPSTNVLVRPAVARMSVKIRATSMDSAAEWLAILNRTPELEGADYSLLEEVLEGDDLTAATLYDITCSAEINLLGLSGKVLEEDFLKWRDATIAALLTATQGGGQ
ncbi:MAG: hypothetical protein LBJ62_04070 [Bifidobacteriaceae bacterium]|jgi:hypothetical protein|nr:hypothetical protein [Bifidobacteriaceae bacterium]